MKLRSLNVVGTRGIVLTVLSTMLLVAFSYTQITPIRFALALLFLFFLPGFDLMEILYSRTALFSGIQRFVVSIGLSIGIGILDDYALTLLNIGINLSSLVAVLSGETIVLSVVPFTIRRIQTLRLRPNR